MTSVLERINEAAKILQQNPWIKDMTNSQFKSVDIDQIRREVGKAETEAGLVVQYRETAFEPMNINNKIFFKVSAVLTYYSIDDEHFENGFEFPRSAIGYDTLDKGWNKAESMLYKNHYKGLYHIGERADDPDSMSNEEYDLLSAFRFAASKNTPNEQSVSYKRFRALVEECEKERKAENRKRKAESADGFFGKKAERTEDDKSEQEFDTTTTEASESEKSSTKMEDIIQQKTIEADEKMVEILQFYQNNKECTIIKDYIKQYGPMVDWQPAITIRCYNELAEVGLI